jgi:hypothetical protein
VATAGAEKVVGGSAVEIQLLVVTAVGHRENKRPVGGLHADVSDQTGVKNFLYTVALVHGAVGAPTKSRARGGGVDGFRHA